MWTVETSYFEQIGQHNKKKKNHLWRSKRNCNDSGDKLFSELESSDSENHIIICGGVHISGTILDNVSSNYCPTPYDFTPIAGLNFHTERTNFIM